MATYEAWKLAVDVALCLSLFLLAFRFIRTGYLTTQSRKGAELEATLRRLIQDAKEAGNELNDELYRRQIALEKALSGIEQAEGKIKNVTRLADEKCSAIDELLARTRSVMDELRESQRCGLGAPAPRRSELRERMETIEEAAQPAVSIRHETRAPSNAPGKPAQRAYTAAQKALSRPEAAAQAATSYSSWLDEVADSGTATEHNASLRDEIEKEVLPPAHTEARQDKKSISDRLQAALSAHKAKAEPAPKGVEEMENIYQLAENLLRAGQSADVVIAKTKLPPRRVQALMQMVEREKSYGGFEEEEEEPATETVESAAGLGALGSGRRSIRSI